MQARLSSGKIALANGQSAGLCTRAYSAPYLLCGFLNCGVPVAKDKALQGVILGRLLVPTNVANLSSKYYEYGNDHR